MGGDCIADKILVEHSIRENMMMPKEKEMPIYESRKSNACALLRADEFQRVVGAAEICMASRSALTSFISTLSHIIQRGMRSFPEGWQAELHDKLSEMLDFALQVSILNMDNDPGRSSMESFYSAAALITGAAGGAFGLPSVLAELPITTGIILRSIADIGRSYGERLEDPEFRATCIEVFAYGTPLEDDIDDEISFVAARIGGIEIAAYIAKVAFRYAAALAPKIAAMSVPVAGSVLGAGLNWAYMNFYQDIARVLFVLLPIEREYEREQVRSCFASIVREMRAKQQTRTRKPRKD
jgi:hypothetical protein